MVPHYLTVNCGLFGICYQTAPKRTDGKTLGKWYHRTHLLEPCRVTIIREHRCYVPADPRQFGTSNGIDLKIITADEAYHDKDGSLVANTGVILTTPPSTKVVAPDHTNIATGAVFCHAQCDFPMLHVGVENQTHEYKCNAAEGECTFSGKCPKNRFLPVDGGYFQHIPHHTELIQRAHAIRKNCERPFNLLKNQTGLETVRVRSQHATMARCTLSSIAVLLIKMAGKRKKISIVKPKQLPLFPDKKAAKIMITR